MKLEGARGKIFMIAGTASKVNGPLRILLLSRISMRFYAIRENHPLCAAAISII